MYGGYTLHKVALFLGILGMLFIIIKCLQNKKKDRKAKRIREIQAYLKLYLKGSAIIVSIGAMILGNIVVRKQNERYEYCYQHLNQIKAQGIIISNGVEKEYTTQYRMEILPIHQELPYQGIQVWLQVKKGTPQLSYGDIVSFNGNYLPSEVQRNFKGFCQQDYDKSQKIYGRIQVEQIEIIGKAEGKKIGKLATYLKKKLEQIFQKAISHEESREIMLGLFLGEKEHLEEEVREDFIKSNLSHLLAVSGMHVSYFVLIIQFLGKKTKQSQKTRSLFLICFLILWMEITGATASVKRACFVGILASLANMVYRKNDFLNSLACALLFILLQNPFSILDIGLLLSFLGTIAIVFVFPILFLKPQQDTLSIMQQENLVQKLINKIKEMVKLTLVIQFTMLPVTIYFFNNLPFTCLISNLIISILVGPIIVLGILVLLFAKVPLLMRTLTYILEILLIIFQKMVKIWANFPLSHFVVVTPWIWSIAGIYFLEIIFLFWKYIEHKKQKRRIEKKIQKNITYWKENFKKNVLRNISIIIVVSTLTSFLFSFSKDVTIYFIDVGQGDSCLIKTKTNKTILMDGGGNKDTKGFNVGKSTMLPYLLDRGVQKIDQMWISHFDSDHVATNLYLLREIKVKNVIIGKQFKDCENYQEFVKIVNEEKINVQVVEAGQRIQVEKDLYFDVLWPSSKQVIEENAINNNSIVCKMVYKNISLLFTGDIEEMAEKAILKKYKDTEKLSANILKTAHHGSKSSSTKEFLNAVKPKIALIGVGKKNTFGHPNIEVLERLKRIWK